MSKGYSEDLRKRVIENYEGGMTKKEITEIFKIGISTLNRWIREYKTTGRMVPKERTKYRQRKFSDADLLEYVTQNPSATLKQMSEHFKVKVSSVWQRLKQLKITRKKKTFLYEERNEQARAEFLKELEKKGEHLVVFIDECGIQNNMKNEYGWAPRGVTVVDDIKGKPTEKINLLAGLLDNQLLAPLTYEFNTDTTVFNTWLEECLIPVLPEHSIIVLDNATFHKSKDTLNIVTDNGHQLLFLPTYSPDLNPIEKFWAILKRQVRNLLAPSETLYSCLHFIFRLTKN